MAEVKLTITERILGYLFTKTKIGKIVDGKKTIFIGAVNIAYFLLEVLNLGIKFFPSYPTLSVIAISLNEFLVVARPYLQGLGITTATVVMIENKRKEKVA